MSGTVPPLAFLSPCHGILHVGATLPVTGVTDHFWYTCLLGLLASVTDGSWPCIVSLICQHIFRNHW
jgi:hypothetical protein